jgi:hypothetical protein
LPPVRTAGGVLVGIIEEVFEVVSWSIRAFYVSVVVINKRDKFTWNLVSLYGSAYNEHKQEFLDELDLIYSINNIHIMVGGDFNLIRDVSEKITIILIKIGLIILIIGLTNSVSWSLNRPIGCTLGLITNKS